MPCISKFASVDLGSSLLIFWLLEVVYKPKCNYSIWISDEWNFNKLWDSFNIQIMSKLSNKYLTHKKQICCELACKHAVMSQNRTGIGTIPVLFWYIMTCLQGMLMRKLSASLAPSSCRPHVYSVIWLSRPVAHAIRLASVDTNLAYLEGRQTSPNVINNRL